MTTIALYFIVVLAIIKIEVRKILLTKSAMFNADFVFKKPPLEVAESSLNKKRLKDVQVLTLDVINKTVLEPICA